MFSFLFTRRELSEVSNPLFTNRFSIEILNSTFDLNGDSDRSGLVGDHYGDFYIISTFGFAIESLIMMLLIIISSAFNTTDFAQKCFKSLFALLLITDFENFGQTSNLFVMRKFPLKLKVGFFQICHIFCLWGVKISFF